jgi:hypothetical protein
MVGGLLIPLYERIDAILVRYGSFNSTQKFRMSVIDYYLKHKDHFKDQSLDSLIANMLREEKILRDIIQEEDYISERYQALKLTATTDEDERQLSRWLEDLENLSKQYWFHDRDLYRYECSLPAGPLRRAYDTWRSKPKWYLDSDLTNDCAGRGGCCGRDCGYCEKRQKTRKRQRGVGHCTVYYGCCAKARGFDLLTNEDREKASEPDWLALKDEFNGTYLCRLLRAYLIGIESEMDAAPKRT